MDQFTHQVRLANWTKIIEKCNNRFAGTTAKHPDLQVCENLVSVKSSGNKHLVDTVKNDNV